MILLYLFIPGILLCSTAIAGETNDNSAASVKKQKATDARTFTEVLDIWDKNKESMTVEEYLSQKPEKIKVSFFGLSEGTTEIKPFRSYFGIGIMSLSGNLDATLTPKQSGLPLAFSQPRQQGNIFALSSGRLVSKNRSDDSVIYSGNTKATDADNSNPLVNSETTTNVLGLEVGEGYNFNNQGIHRGIILGGGFGFQRVTITNKTTLLNTPIIEREVRVHVGYLCGKIGYGYLFDNNLYLTAFLKRGLPFYSSYEGGNDEEYSSSDHLFLNPMFQLSLKRVF